MKKSILLLGTLLLSVSMPAQMIVNSGARLRQTGRGYFVLNNGDFQLINRDIEKLFILSNLKINANASLTIDHKSYLNVLENISNLSDVDGLVLNSSANSTASLLHNNESVSATIKRYIAGNTNISNTFDYHLVSVPINASALSGLFTGMYLYKFDQTAQSWQNLGNSVSTELPNNEGYMVFLPNEATIVNISGKLNNDSFTARTTMTLNEFALVPNPYPSAINWDAPEGWTRTNLKDYFYLWDPVANNYVSWSAGAGTAGSPHIPVGQSFFVKADGSSPLLVINNAARLHSEQTFLKKGASKAADVLLLKVEGYSSSDALIVRFDEHASMAYGYMDVDKLYGASDSPQIYSLSLSNDKLTTNALRANEGKMEIPIGFECLKNGLFSFAATGMESFRLSNIFTLEDKLLNRLIPLNNEPVYQFEHDTTNDPMRFVLHIQGAASEKEETTRPAHIWACQNQLIIDIPDLAGKTASIEVFDISGKLLLTEYIQLASSSRLSLPIKAKVAVVRVTTEKTVVTRKVIHR